MKYSIRLIICAGHLLVNAGDFFPGGEPARRSKNDSGTAEETERRTTHGTEEENDGPVVWDWSYE